MPAGYLEEVYRKHQDHFTKDAASASSSRKAAHIAWADNMLIHGRSIGTEEPVEEAGDAQLIRFLKMTRIVTSIAGPLVFAWLTTLGLATSSRLIVAVASVAAGYLLGTLFDAALVFVTKASARNPDALRIVRTVAFVSAVAAIIAVALFMYLRFAADETALWLFSCVAVLFELGLFALSAATHAALLTLSWTVDLPRAYAAAGTKQERFQVISMSCESELDRMFEK